MKQKEGFPDPILAEHRRKKADLEFQRSVRGEPHDATQARMVQVEAAEEIIVSNRVAPSLREQARRSLLALTPADLSQRLELTRRNEDFFKKRAMGRIDEFSSPA